MMFAAGMPAAMVQLVGNTLSTAGATPKLQLMVAPEQTCGQPMLFSLVSPLCLRSLAGYPAVSRIECMGASLQAQQGPGIPGPYLPKVVISRRISARAYARSGRAGGWPGC